MNKSTLDAVMNQNEHEIQQLNIKLRNETSYSFIKLAQILITTKDLSISLKKNDRLTKVREKKWQYLIILMSSLMLTWSGTRNLVLSRTGSCFSPLYRSIITGILVGCCSRISRTSSTLCSAIKGRGVGIIKGPNAASFLHFCWWLPYLNSSILSYGSAKQQTHIF